MKRILAIIPQEMLLGLNRIALLGGTTRQEKSAWNANWCYGCYGYGSVSLFAFPERRRVWESPDLHKPSEIHAYQRAGVEMAHEGGKWIYRFTDDSIRRFYLWDVLVHEIGHHVDRSHPDRSTKRSERYAEWFARTYGFEAEQSDARRVADGAFSDGESSAATG
ncbi:metallopeptidase family protein [Crateriforma conspicua]|uniref:metallopeptidase family protein n=1 Tax=Crateriforma conspicua TaxID=2527996 RepID=UPI0011A4D504|nr:metallopeptidase family protein [Crateriforma conspicua]